MRTQRLRDTALYAKAPAPAQAVDKHITGQVRVLTCGSVDDGKSTLIGRLLWDASDLFEDQREALRKSTRRVLDGTHLDYSLLVDGLLAEREQGITIDIAWRYFDSANRRFVIIDSPGHAQYTRNMASGASHADVAIMLIDARHGIKTQTRRHAALLDLFGVRRVILAINKMDLVDWSEARYREIEADLKTLVWKFRFDEVTAIPVAAVTGDNVARRSEAMHWYRGPTLFDQLNRTETHGGAAAVARESFRMPVQTVIRDGQDFRGLAGTVTAGSVAVGEEVVDTVSGAAAKVARIVTMDGDIATASAGRAIALVLDRDLDISRGAVLAKRNAKPTAARQLDVRLVWLSEAEFDPGARYLLRTATDLVPIASLAVDSLLDLESLARKPSTVCAVNDIALARIELGRATALDLFASAPATGGFVLVDAIDGATVAGGVVTAAAATTSERGANRNREAFSLTRDLLDDLCADLDDTAGAHIERERRSRAVAEILRAAGVTVDHDTATKRKR